MNKEVKIPAEIRCADCRMSTPLSTPFGDPALVQCNHTLLVRVANSMRKCENYLPKKEGR